MASSFSQFVNQQYTFSRYEEFVREMINRSEQQMQDSYDVQKIYDGTPGSSVWSGRNRWHYRNKDFTQGRVKITNWHEESEWRRKNDHDGNMWYSTGRSRQVFGINLVSDSLRHGVIEVNTTFGMLMAEQGVGMTGPNHVRGQRSHGELKRIKVQRDQDYVAKQRYVGDWKPMQGATHRPTTRRQANWLAKRIRNFAADLFGWNISTWIITDIATSLDGLPIEMTFDALGNMHLNSYLDGKKAADLTRPDKLPM